jgi:hypothetical protein
VQAEQRQEIEQAAAEVGLPREYLERAAAIVDAQRSERHIPRPRRQRLAMLSALGLAAGVALSVGLHGVRGTGPSAPPTAPAKVVSASPSPVTPLIGPCTEVDLSRHVTHRLDQPMLPTPGNNLVTLVSGLTADGVTRRIMHGVPFRLDGVVLVGPGETANGEGISVEVAPQVEGITIGRKVRRLHFLQGTHWRADGGTKVGAYIVHYQDGTRLEIPIRYGEDVRDWWVVSDRETQVSGARVAWSGSNEATAQARTRIRLYMKSWENPYPDRTIRSLDMVTGDQPSGPSASAPFLVGLTVEQERSTAGPASQSSTAAD